MYISPQSPQLNEPVFLETTGYQAQVENFSSQLKFKPDSCRRGRVGFQLLLRLSTSSWMLLSGDCRRPIFYAQLKTLLFCTQEQLESAVAISASDCNTLTGLSKLQAQDQQSPEWLQALHMLRDACSWISVSDSACIKSIYMLEWMIVNWAIWKATIKPSYFVNEEKNARRTLDWLTRPE